MSILKYLTPSYWRNRRQEKQRLATLATLAKAVAEINKYKEANLLYWRPKERYYIIEQTLADLYLSSPKLWQGFMKMLFIAAVDERTTEARRWAEAEAKRKAVLAAHDVTSNLTDADKARIGRNAVANLPPTTPVSIPDFDFGIIRADVLSVSDSIGELVAVGHYDGNTLEMSLYEDIKHNLSA